VTKKSKVKPNVADVKNVNEPANPMESVEERHTDGQFFIVGMGGSAGGFEAYEEFFKNIPNDTGMGSSSYHTWTPPKWTSCPT